MAEGRRAARFPNKTCFRTLDKKRRNGKSGLPVETRPHEPAKDLQQPKTCPECGRSGSSAFYRDGLRYLVDGSATQRWLCRFCGNRFSLPSSNGFASATKDVEHLNNNRAKNAYRQVCELLTEDSKNLAATETKTVAGEIKGLLTQFLAYLEREGYPRNSNYPHNIKTLARLGANLTDPEHVKRAIGKHEVKNGTKLQYIHAYAVFAKMLKIPWNPPKCQQEESLPFVPDESALDQLIASCRSSRMAAFLQVLKETWVDPGEALGLRWIDISGNTVTINQPVKRHSARRLQISNRLVMMLNALPKTSEKVFPVTYQNLFSCYAKVRRRAAAIQKDPKLLSIQLRSFRHWGGSMLAYHLNGNVVKVQKLLGHKRIENTMKYIDSNFTIKEDDFDTATASTDEEIKKLGSAGWQKYDERKIGELCISYYRRPKRFSKYV